MLSWRALNPLWIFRRVFTSSLALAHHYTRESVATALFLNLIGLIELTADRLRDINLGRKLRRMRDRAHQLRLSL
jgi:hypothetical protein